jgi:Zn-dependent peptidase ImmA (M78 family)
LSPNIPYLTYTDIGRKAQEFLSQHYPSLELPIPIERIIDVELGLNIFPFPRLYKDFKQNGFLSRDRSTIYVDEIQSDEFPEKYRFTLAHELGHFVLHKNYYEDLSFESVDEFIKWKLSVPQDEIGWFETHADWFAEQVLVPITCLEATCKEIIDNYQHIFSQFTVIPDDFWSYISKEVARPFEVNPPVIELRIKRTGLADRISIIKNNENIPF